MITIRNATESDQPAIRDCFIDLQRYECGIEPNRADAEQVAAPYLEDLLGQCRKGTAAIFVAECDSRVVGFVGVIPQQSSDDILEQNREYAYITDLIVLETYRRHGIARQLLQAAEEHAVEHRAHTIRVGVLAANGPAHELYHTAGFRDYEVVLEKPIRAATS